MALPLDEMYSMLRLYLRLCLDKKFVVVLQRIVPFGATALRRCRWR